jgi:transposase
VPHGHWTTTTFLAALHHDRVDAPWLIDGPTNGRRFRLHVEKVLAPTLCRGDIVNMDNLGSHKGKAIRATIRAVGAKLFLLPKYSPDFNPNEMLFAKIRHWLRHARARSVDGFCEALAAI